MLDALGCNFASASNADKVILIDQAIGRVMWSQESEMSTDRNKRALLSELQATRKYYYELQWYAANPSTFALSCYYRF